MKLQERCECDADVGQPSPATGGPTLCRVRIRIRWLPTAKQPPPYQPELVDFSGSEVFSDGMVESEDQNVYRLLVCSLVVPAVLRAGRSCLVAPPWACSTI